ncbi:MAG: T9SS type B sorting domain-containing protein [Flavobacterium sp.]|nr:MAG: T9SS type B sorting domain-containing protein [Flavobacterium sp.]
MKKNLFLLLLLLIASTGIAQFSKTHYIPPVSASDNVVPQEQFLYISTPNLTPVNFRIIRLGTSEVTGTVSRNAPYIYNIGVGVNTQLNASGSECSTVLSDKGFIVEAEDLIYVTVRVIAGSGNQAGEVVSKGLAALGTEFRIGAFLNTAIPFFDETEKTFISVMATENNTFVQFSDIKPGVSIINNPVAGNTPPGVMLNSGQSYVLAVEGPTNANRDGLIGSLVTSDKPIAVTCGSFGGSNGELSNLDLGFDQIVSVERTGKDYIFIKSTGQNAVERILLIANEDDTDIFLGTSTTPAFTIDAGEYVALGGAYYSPSGNLFVHTSKNVFAYQSIGDDGRPDQANQEMFFVPPLSCETPRIIDNIPNLNEIGTRVFNGRVTLVTLTGATLNFVIDGNPYPLAALPSGVIVTGPTAVAGNPDYVTYIITGLSENVSVFSSGQLYLASYGSSDAATFGGYYSGFTFKPEIAFARIDLAQPNCLPNVALSVSPLTAFDIFQWYFNDVPIAGATSSSYTPTQPGYYHVSATIGACGTTLISDKIPVSSCATNMDDDLANDNIDLDNDNDGITNCTESYGSIPINLSNPSGGNITLSTYSNSFTGSFPPAVGTPAAVPFAGAADGSFVAQVTAGKGNSVSYRMDFVQPVSYTFDYPQTASAANLITSGAEYIVSAPVNQTMTVLNPTNQLLIDTNYDGIYESGITEYSSFEIRFRLNSATPLAAGTGTFKFQSYLANSFTFTLRNLTDSATANATFRILASCLPKDSDLDGIPDQIDQDSDNDGIPDLYESQGSNFQQLSLADANLDGLDNIFGNGFTPADSDNDGVFNYLDLDSDNNGIFDLVESGSGATDANGNGIVDGNAASFGVNGLSNQLEDAPDSGTISYTLSDTDSDTLFDYIDPDNDNDLCSDVREAGFSDPNNDGFLGNNVPPTVNSGGVVTGAGGYTVPNPEYTNPTPIDITIQPSDVTTCEAQNATFTVEATAGVTFQWQVSANGVNYANISDGSQYTGTQTATLTVNSVVPSMEGYHYRVLLNRTGNICGLFSSDAVLSINPLPGAVTRTIVQCDSGNAPDGFTVFNLSEADALFTANNATLVTAYFENLTDAQADTAQLPLEYTNISNPQAIVVRVTNTATGCFSFSTLTLSVNVLPNQQINLPEVCDYDGIEDGFHTFNLTTAPVAIGAGQTIKYYENETDALLEQNAIANPQAYVNLQPYAPQIVYARVENQLGCAGIAQIHIKVNPLPQIEVNDALENHVVCVNSMSFTTTLDAGILDGTPESDYTYQWAFEGTTIAGAHSSTLTVSTIGTYTVKVTNADGCFKVRTIPVISSSTAIIEDIAITDLSENNTVTVTISSNSYGNYVYSLDHLNAFQTSNVFTNVAPGIHVVYVKDLNGCPVANQEISVLGIPAYFTPNGDGYHDTWSIKGVNSRYGPNTLVMIFDRYGKLLKEFGATMEWDGTYNGQPMPSTDYWYVIKLDDGRMFKGHFALKR